MKFLVPSMLAPLLLMACGGGTAQPVQQVNGAPSATANADSAYPQQFHVRLENIAPWTNLKTGSFGTKIGGSAAGPIGPGEAYRFQFTAGPHSNLAFTAMLGQSNDWFFSTPAKGIPLFQNGAPISGDITAQIGLFDAGTQVDEEPAVGPHTGPNRATSTDGPGAADPDPHVRRVLSPTVLSSGASFNTPATAAMINVSIQSDAATHLFVVTLTNVASDTNTLITSQGPKPVRVSPGVWVLGTGNEPIFTLGLPDRGEGLKQQAENGDNSGLATSLPEHSGVATALSPGVWAVHASGAPLFTTGSPDYGKGLTQIAEAGNNAPLKASLAARPPTGVSQSGSFETAVGASSAGPIVTGGAYEFNFMASPGDNLSLATMFGWSTDWFFAPGAQGIPLFNGKTPIDGDISDSISLWDDGATLSEAPETGLFTGNSAAAPADIDNTVRLVPHDVYSHMGSEHIRLTLTPVY